MPQFDPAFFTPQLFWLAILFGTLYVVMARHALPRIGEVLEERQRRIDENLDKAAQMKAEAEAAIAAYEQALADSRAKAAEVMREASERMAKQAEVRSKELSERLAEQIKAGEARIIAAKEQALANVRQVAAEVAGATVNKLVGVSPDEGKLAAAVATAMQEHSR